MDALYTSSAGSAGNRVETGYSYNVPNQHQGAYVDQAFHVYALEWTPERIDAFVDDSHYFTYVNEGTGWRAWPYDHPFHLILNIAVGGAWGRAGGPIDDGIFPLQMEVDYARVYQRRE